MSLGVHCVVCDTRIDPYGRDGATCARCQQPCATCGGPVQNCQHPLQAEQLTETLGDPFLNRRAA